MNKFVIGALALTSAGSLAYAGGTETKEWSTLDRDILSLTSSQAPAGSQFSVSGYVRSRYAHSNDVDVDTGTAGKQKLGGFSMDNARVILDGSQGDYGVHVELDAIDTVDVDGIGPLTQTQNTVGSVALLDAYATAGFGDGLKAQMGRFRAPFLWSALIGDNNLILLDRTFNGEVWDGRQEGAQLSGAFDKIAFWVALQNGTDGVADEYSWTGRVAFSPLGHVGTQEGAYGAAPDTGLTLGAAYSDDSAVSKGAAWCIDATLVQGGFSLQGELVDYSDDITPNAGMNLCTGVLNPNGIAAAAVGSHTPWSATAGLLVNQQIELVARYEDLDDSNNTTQVTVGINFYASGHNAKLTVEGVRSNSDVALKEADTFAVGVTVGV